MEPDLVAADVGQGFDVVDRAGQCRAGGGDNRDRGHPVLAISCDRLRARLYVHPSVLVDRDRADVPPADAEDLGGAAHRVMRLRGAIQRHLAVARAVVADARERALAGRGQRGQVGDGAAGREQAACVVVEADELADPPDRLRLEQVGGAGAVRDVDVMRGHQCVGEDADLEARGADVREPSWARLGERAVEDVGGCVQRFVGVGRCARERATQQLAGAVVGERLARPGVIEALPGLGDQFGGMLEHALAVGKREGRALGLRRVGG